MAAELTEEILIKIFFHLTPFDLYSLSSVCKRFRSILWPTSDVKIQEIWSVSRLQHTNLYYLPPIISIDEEGNKTRMSEQQYIWLMILCEKCQFCGQKNKNKLTLYWEIKAHCCSECLKEKVISKDKLISEWEFPESLIRCLVELPKIPGINYWEPQMYFISEASNLLKECDQVEEHEREYWISNKEYETIKLKKGHEFYRNVYSERNYFRKMIALIEEEDSEKYPDNHIASLIDRRCNYNWPRELSQV